MQKLGTAKTIRFEDYLIISLSGKWEQAFGRLPEFEVKLDKREGVLARDNYSYKKYQKELANKKKQEEKRQSKLAKKNAQAKADPERTPNEDVAS